MSDIIIRMATMDDAAAMLDIYAPYVRDTAITFEYTVPSVQEFSDRIQHTLTRYPWLLAEKNGCIIGYAYASAFKARQAYDWAVETSIYVARESRGKGVGRLLHDALENLLQRQGILNMCACIAIPHENADETLDYSSMHFHEHMHYRPVGRFHMCGCKFGRWYDLIWMERHIGEHTKNPGPIKRIGEIKNDRL